MAIRLSENDIKNILGDPNINSKIKTQLQSKIPVENKSYREDESYCFVVERPPYFLLVFYIAILFVIIKILL